MTNVREHDRFPHLGRQADLGSRLERNFQVGVAVAAAVLALIAGIVAASVTSRHEGFPAAVAIALVSLIVVSLISGVLAQTVREQSPSLAAQQAAITRIRTIIDSLLYRYGMEEPAIHPPVKLLDQPHQRNEQELERYIESVSATTSDAFISQQASNPRVTLILGNDGSGKTSLLLRLAQRMLADRPPGSIELIPLFFQSRDWTEEHDSFHEWIVDTAFRAYRIPVSITDYWIRTGKLFVVLDGLDEVSPDRFDQFGAEIHAWAQAAGGTRMAASAKIDLPTAQRLARILEVDQICLIQPLPDSDIQRYVQGALSKLSSTPAHQRVTGMNRWIRELVSRSDSLKGPALVGLLAEALEESEQLPGTREQPGDEDDPALVAFQMANESLSHGDFRAATRLYRAITNSPRSRWHIPAYALLGTCLYLLGDTSQAREAMLESVALRLQQNIQPSPYAMEQLSGEQAKCLAAVPLRGSYDLAQISSAAGLTISQSRLALRVLRERGLVETVENTTDERARFRRSVAPALSQ